jgi:glucosamine--fructose-6-phosphate aminotransferase (isomerizing)
MPDLRSTVPVTPTGYLRDILDQPIALRDTLAAFPDFPSVRPFAERLAAGDLRRVVLTGMGSSYHALHPLALTLIARGLPVQMLETSELIHYAPSLLDPRTLLVVVSQSGRSAEVVGLLERARGRVPLVGVTNTADSPLTAQSDAVLLTRAGDEFSVSTKTYIAALAALAWLGGALAGQDTLAVRQALEGAPDALEHYLAPWADNVEALGKQLADVRYLVLVGRGSSLAAVGTGALIVKESAHFPTEGLSSAAFRHGPLEMVAPDIFVLVFSGAAATAELNARLADDIRAAGGQAALVRESAVPDVFALPPVPDIARPLLELLPVQMLSVALARLKGHEAGRFGRASKVTLTE